MSCVVLIIAASYATTGVAMLGKLRTVCTQISLVRAYRLTKT